jgi:hypothetical protein
MLVDIVVHLGKAQHGAGKLLEDVPIRFHMLDDCVPR